MICNPVPEADALPLDVARDAIRQALREAEVTGVSGGAVTPWLLARVAALTNGASVRANISLITDNARVAGLLAGELARAGLIRRRGSRRPPPRAPRAGPCRSALIVHAISATHGDEQPEHDREQARCRPRRTRAAASARWS